MDDPSITRWLIAMRAVHFACCLLIGSIWAFDRLVMRQSTLQWRRVAASVLWFTIPLAFVTGVVWFVLVACGMSDFSFQSVIHNYSLLKMVWLNTRFGRVWQIHLTFWFATLILSVAWITKNRGQWFGVIAAAGLVASLAGAGHGMTGVHPGWHIICDTIHLLTACLWPAGLVPFALLVSQLARSKLSERAVEILITTQRFSCCSMTAVGLLAFTGTINSICLLDSASNLWTTSYGRILTIKVVLFVLLIGLGAMNLLHLKPRLARGGDVVRLLLRNVCIEIVLTAGVILLVGLLGLSEPPH